MRTSSSRRHLLSPPRRSRMPFLLDLSKGWTNHHITNGELCEKPQGRVLDPLSLLWLQHMVDHGRPERSRRNLGPLRCPRDGFGADLTGCYGTGLQRYFGGILPVYVLQAIPSRLAGVSRSRFGLTAVVGETSGWSRTGAGPRRNMRRAGPKRTGTTYGLEAGRTGSCWSRSRTGCRRLWF